MGTEYRAVVTLTPRNEKSDVKRIITFDAPDTPIIIGRASKTTSKGLVGLPENAWFNSPIMSREHGKMFMTSTGAVHIEDCASTHGTFIEPRRLEPKKSYKLSDGDVVTFGSTITSGPVTYYGRSFSVQISSVNVNPQISPSSTTSKASERSGFHVPNDEVESISDVSEAESCLIVKANPRKFSVPSSGDEEEETDDDVIISTSRRAFLARKPHNSELRQISQQPDTSLVEAVRPEQPTETLSEAESQQHSAALCESSPVSDSLFVDNSVDEEPDSILSGQAQQEAPTESGVTADSMSITEIPETYQSAPRTVLDAQTHHSSDGDEDKHEGGSYAVSPQVSAPTSTASNYGSESPFSGSPSVPESASGDDSDEDDHHSTGQSVGGGSSASAYPGVHSQSAQDHFPAPQVPLSCPSGLFGVLVPAPSQEAVENPLCFESPSFQSDFESPNLRSPNFQSPSTQSSRRGVSDFDYTQYLQRNPTLYNPATSFCEAWTTLKTRARAPSPSDAALFRKATSNHERSDSPLIAGARDNPGSHSYKGPSGHLRPLNEPNYGHSIVPPASIFGHAPVIPPPTRPRSSFVAYANQVSHDWQTGPADVLKPSRVKPGEYQQGPFSRLQGPTFSEAESSLAARPPPSTSSPQKHCVVKLKYDPYPGKDNQSDKEIQPNNVTSHEDSVSPSYPKPDPTKSSKVDISNLVNTEKSRSLKRKSDQISSEGQASSAVGVVSQLLLNSSISQSQDGTAVLNGDTAPTSTAASLPQDLTPTSAQPVLDTALEEPARKKAKTTSSKVGTIGGLVSGLCLGVVGAVAAFIAAIPADVRNEALCETIKLM
ncbi:MAG: hypothetical protein Q9207_003334 [Kuettlingeria erythrocarpa]